MSKILIKNAEIVTDGPDYPKKYIGITDRKITYIGKDKPEGYDDAQVIDATGKLAAAGMVNAHTHIAMCCCAATATTWRSWTGCRTRSGLPRRA